MTQEKSSVKRSLTSILNSAATRSGNTLGVRCSCGTTGNGPLFFNEGEVAITSNISDSNFVLENAESCMNVQTICESWWKMIPKEPKKNMV